MNDEVYYWPQNEWMTNDKKGTDGGRDSWNHWNKWVLQWSTGIINRGWIDNTNG